MINISDNWKGRYVQRDKDGVVTGSYACAQPGYAEEPLEDVQPDLVAFDAKMAAAMAPSARRLVPKSLIIARLQEAGKLAAASAAINVDLYVRERWYAPDRPAIYADDPEALALLTAIGADPKVILA